MYLITIGGHNWLKKIGIAVLLVLVLIVFLGLIYSNIRTVSTSKRLLPIYSVGTDEKKVALSFDATWGAEHTDKILNILKENNIKTTFFLVNIWLEDYPQEAKAIVEAGHEIGMHSASHPHFTTLSTEKIKEELVENNQLINKITGFNAFLFRPPFGDYNDTVIKTVNELGYTAIQWDVDSLDWREGYTAKKIYDRVTQRVKPGSIILFHNNGQYTAEALPSIISYLRENSYQIVKVSELIYKGDYYIDVNGVQRTL